MFKFYTKQIKSITPEQNMGLKRVRSNPELFTKRLNYYLALNADPTYGRVLKLDGSVEHEGWICDQEVKDA